jgi:hypothetical protein
MLNIIILFLLPACFLTQLSAETTPIHESAQVKAMTEKTPATKAEKKSFAITETTDLALVEKEVKNNGPIMVLGYKNNSATSNVIRNMAKSAINAINHKYKDAGLKAFFIDVEQLKNEKLERPGQLIFYNHGKEMNNKTISVAQVYPYKKLYLEIEKSLDLANNQKKQDQKELQKEEETIELMIAEVEQQQAPKISNKRKKKHTKPLKCFASKDLSSNPLTRSAMKLCRQACK